MYDDSREKQMKLYQNVLCSVIILLCLIVIGLLLFWLCAENVMQEFAGFDYNYTTVQTTWKTFNLHPLLMTLAFGFCAPLAVVSFKLLQTTHTRAKYVHSAFHFLAVLCSSFGLWFVHDVKVNSKSAEWYSVHAWVGLAALVMYWLQWAVGFIFFLVAWKVAPDASQGARAAVVVPHRFLGYFFWSTTIIALVTGLLDRIWILRNQITIGERSAAFVLANFVAISLILVLWAVTYVLYHFVNTKKQRSSDVITPLLQ